jgi:hypothetical protein
MKNKGSGIGHTKKILKRKKKKDFGLVTLGCVMFV